jgi:hypothetical protein
LVVQPEQNASSAPASSMVTLDFMFMENSFGTPAAHIETPLKKQSRG